MQFKGGITITEGAVTKMSVKTKISVMDLKKQYGEEVVLNGISFDVLDGGIFALLGTNGAGKTTTLECLEGIRKYNSGNINIVGKLGVQLQSSSLFENIRVIETLKLYAKWNKTSIDMSFVEKLGLKELLKKQYGQLSTGQKRRLHLALAMTGNPDIIILDEPTAGLDVEGRAALHDIIRKLNAEGKTILMASHDMAEVETLCDKIAILKDGEIAFIGTANELTNQMRNTYKIHLKLSAKLLLEKYSICIDKGDIQGYYVFESNKIDEGIMELLMLAKQQNITVYDLKTEQASLEECFINIAKGTKA